MAENYRKVTEFKTLSEFSEYLKSEHIELGLSEVPADGSSAMAQPIEHNGSVIGNRWAILPMEGWDCTDDGAPSEYTRRRWLNFARSGAKLIYGTEAAAVSKRLPPRRTEAIMPATWVPWSSLSVSRAR